MTCPDLKRKREVKNICCIGGGYVVCIQLPVCLNPLFYPITLVLVYLLFGGVGFLG